MTGRVTGILDAAGFAVPLELRKQIISLDGEFLEMEREITRLNAKVLHLESKVNPLEREINGLKEKLKSKSGLRPSDEENKIMQLICHKQKSMYVGEIAKELSANTIRIQVSINTLIERGLVRKISHWQGGYVFYLTDDGMSYSVEQGWA